MVSVVRLVNKEKAVFPTADNNASLLKNSQLISHRPLLVSIEKEDMLLIKKNALPSIHPNKLQVFLGSLVPLLVSDAIFLHNRFETWRVRGQREMGRERER